MESPGKGSNRFFRTAYAEKVPHNARFLLFFVLQGGGT